MEAWQAAMLAVFALLVGAMLPAALQLAPALRSLRASATQAERAFAAVAATADRLERLSARVEQGGRLEHLLEAIDSLSRTVTRLQETARIASAVGATVAPAVGAAVRSWRQSREDGAPASNGAGAASPHPEREEAPT